MKKMVISLGGSQIFNNGQINVKFLDDFKRVILKNTKNWRFVVVCGGGVVARTYIEGLRKIKAIEKLQSYIGISVTRTNARFMSYYFGDENYDGIPHKLEEIGRMLKRKRVVFCGALEYHPKQTSDSTASQIASYINSEFVNITNVQGLHDKNPKEHKDAKFIPSISWKEFYKMASKIEFKPGQHFVLDQTAARIIMKNKIKTYIIGTEIRNLDSILNNKPFHGTIIYG
ncbi:MAG: UMP kinase [Candidatus Pacearchaeota archaeon]